MKGGENMTDKEILAKNLQKYMDMNGKSRNDVCKALGFNYYTFTDWVNGKKMPRMDKITKLAAYFGVQKSDLIEEKLTPEKEKDNAVLVNIIVRMRTDPGFKEVVESIYNMNEEKLSGIKQMIATLNTFAK